MTPTPIGIALLLLGIFYFFARPGRLMPAVVFFASFSGTSVLNSANFGISPSVMLFVLYLVRRIAFGEILRPIEVGRNHPGLALLLCVFAAYVIGTLFLSVGDHQLQQIQFTQLLYLLVGILIAVILSFEISRDGGLQAAINAMRAGACFIASWGVLQAVCFYGGLAYPAFLFNNSTSHYADMFDQRAGDSVIRLASVATEPSFLAISLMIFGSFGASVLVCEPSLRKPSWIIPVALVLGIVAASTSTTGLFSLAVLGLLLALRRPGIVTVAALGAGLALAVALLMLPAFRAALYGMSFGKSQTGSFRDRGATVVEALGSIVAHPWLGGGWGSNYSYSIITNLPANVGLLGTALFIAALAGTILTSMHSRRRLCHAGQPHLRAYALGAENAMIVYMAQAAVSGFKYVVPDFWCLWALCLAIPSCAANALAVQARKSGRDAQRSDMQVRPDVQAKPPAVRGTVRPLWIATPPRGGSR